jgi:hypothetical protein
MNNLKALEKIIKYGTPSHVNINIQDHISSEYPLRIPFHLDDQTSMISSIDFHYMVEKINTLDEPQSNYFDSITIYIDGTHCISANNERGTIDLSAWVTTPGWHELEIHSKLLIKIKTQLNIKSFESLVDK